MNIERRGKYPGVKIHLDEIETRRVMDVLFGGKTAPVILGPERAQVAFKIICKMAKLIEAELVEAPDLLDPRTPEQIKAELITERDKAIAKLAKMEEGVAWNEK